MEKFEKIVFDFANVELIGQGFADEIFRVFAKQHPNIEIETIHTAEEVKNMIRHVTYGDYQSEIHIS